MKLKILYITLFITIMACAQNTTQTSFSEEELINKTISALNIDKSQTEFTLSRVSPNNPKETIIVITVIVDEEEESHGLDIHIVIVDNSTGEITHTLFENSKENGWVSHAEFVYDITIDSLNYKLNDHENAFTVTAKFRTMSQSNPYYSESLSLYNKENNSLKKVLDSFTVYESFGEINFNGCSSNIEKTTNTLSMSNTQTNGYNDILVNEKKSIINHFEDENGDCNPKETENSIRKFLLEFDGELYILKN